MGRALINIGYLYLGSSEFDSAHYYCDKALKIDTSNRNWQLTKAQIFQAEGNYDEAVSRYKSLIAKDSLDNMTIYYLGFCYYQMERYNESIKQLDKVITANANNAVAYYFRGLSYYSLENYKAALNDFNLLIKLNPENIYGWYARGLTKLNTKDYKGAEVDFTQVITLNPKMPDAYRTRAHIRAAMNDVLGYLNDKSMADTLLKRGIPEVDASDLNYMRQITSFKSDFTTTGLVKDSKVQYADYEMNMFPIYTLGLRYTSKYKLPGASEKLFNEINLMSPQGYDFACVLSGDTTNLLSQGKVFKVFVDTLQGMEAGSANQIILQAIRLNFEQKYTECNTLIDKYHENKPADPLLYFIRGNNYAQLAEIIQSIDNKSLNARDTESKDDNSITNPVVIDYYKKSAASYSVTIDLSPGFIYASYNRAYVNSLLNNTLQAVFDLNYCITEKEDFAEAYFNRGILHLLLKNKLAGCRDLSRAGELGINRAYRVIYFSCNN